MVEDVVAATEVLITQRAKVHRHVPPFLTCTLTLSRDAGNINQC
jgi:hypothetical protein